MGQRKDFKGLRFLGIIMVTSFFSDSLYAVKALQRRVTQNQIAQVNAATQATQEAADREKEAELKKADEERIEALRVAEEERIEALRVAEEERIEALRVAEAEANQKIAEERTKTEAAEREKEEALQALQEAVKQEKENLQQALEKAKQGKEELQENLDEAADHMMQLIEITEQQGRQIIQERAKAGTLEGLMENEVFINTIAAAMMVGRSNADAVLPMVGSTLHNLPTNVRNIMIALHHRAKTLPDALIGLYTILGSPPENGWSIYELLEKIVKILDSDSSDLEEAFEKVGDVVGDIKETDTLLSVLKKTLNWIDPEKEDIETAIQSVANIITDKEVFSLKMSLDPLLTRFNALLKLNGKPAQKTLDGTVTQIEAMNDELVTLQERITPDQLLPEGIHQVDQLIGEGGATVHEKLTTSLKRINSILEKHGKGTRDTLQEAVSDIETFDLTPTPAEGVVEEPVEIQNRIWAEHTLEEGLKGVDHLIGTDLDSVHKRLTDLLEALNKYLTTHGGEEKGTLIEAIKGLKDLHQVLPPFPDAEHLHPDLHVE